MTRLLAFLALLGGTASGAAAQRVDARADTLRTSGLQQPVEVLRDRWGVNHIYAKNEHDLFFAQGYLAAKDRTFQFELWRRQATGTLAELLGEREVQRDVGVRLFKYRGDKATELTRYHPRGPAIVDAFVEGVNAFVAATRRDTTLIPLELRMLGARPEPWTWEVVVSRHGGLLGNVTDELSNGRFVAAHGAALLKKLTWYHPGPGEPVVTLDSAVDGAALAAPILDVFNAFRGAVRFRREDLQVAYRGDPAAAARLAALEVAPESAPRPEEIGSNNWVVSPRLSLSGNAIMANDPHRAISVPSLRYYSHLVAPGWDVIGGGEPTIPGISIGHNARGAWGLTIFTVDGEDLYVYRTCMGRWCTRIRRGISRMPCAPRGARRAARRTSRRCAWTRRRRGRSSRRRARSRTSRARTWSGRAWTARSAGRRWASRRCGPTGAGSCPCPATAVTSGPALPRRRRSRRA
jgi:penicillin amidase